MPLPPDPAVARRALDELRGLLREALVGRRVRVLLFGSWARQEATRQSDVDVALLGDGPLPPSLLASLRESIEESHVPYRVDLVDLGASEPAFRDRVLREGVPWTV